MDVMTVWTGTLYLVDQQGRDHVAEVRLPGPISLSRQRLAALPLPEGFRALAAGPLVPAGGAVPPQPLLGNAVPHVWRNRATALSVEDISFDSPPRMAADLPCPAGLAEALLPAGDETRLYLLFDAARLAPLMRVFDPADLLGGQRGAALFLSDGVARQSPWLVDVTPLADGTPPRLLRQFLRTGWNQRAGIFLRSRAGFDEMFRFLRGFTRVGAGAGGDKTILLRFWDPLVARHWFAAQSRDPARVQRLFWTQTGAHLEILGETGATGFFRMSPTAFAPEGQVRKGLLTLGDADRRALQDAALATLGRDLSRWILDARPDRFAAFTHRRMAAAEAHVLAVGQQYKLPRKEDFAALLHVMVQLGGWFHQGGAAPELTDILKAGGKDTGKRLTDALQSLAPQLPQARMAAKWAAVTATLAAIPPENRLDTQAFRQLTAMLGAPDDPRINGAVQAALRDVSGLGLTRTETGIVLALSLIYGHRYYDDPLRVWALTSGIDRDRLISLSARLWPQVETDM